MLVPMRAAPMQVTRRFGDFEALHRLLHVEQRGLIIPPLPPKAFLGEANLGESFLHQRRADLQAFLRALVAHPSLQVGREGGREGGGGGANLGDSSCIRGVGIEREGRVGGGEEGWRDPFHVPHPALPIHPSRLSPRSPSQKSEALRLFLLQPGDLNNNPAWLHLGAPPAGLPAATAAGKREREGERFFNASLLTHTHTHTQRTLSLGISASVLSPRIKPA